MLKKPCKNQRQYMLSPPAFYRFGTFAFRTEESVGMLIGYARVSKADGSQALSMRSAMHSPPSAWRHRIPSRYNADVNTQFP